MKKQWSFLINPFLKALFSYLMGVRASILHDAALFSGIADPEINTLYLAYHPVHTAYVEAYDNWFAHGGTQKSDTLSLTQLLSLSKGAKSKAWEAAVTLIYAPGSVEYIAVLPKGRKPFRAGKQTAKIAAVAAFSIALADYPLLAAIKTDVDAFLVQLNDANTKQKGSKTTTKSMSSAMEKAFNDMCDAQYGDLGFLIWKFRKTPLLVKKYFDMPLLHQADQVLFHGHAPINKNYFIVKHTAGIADKYKFTNLGVTEVIFYVTDSKTGVMGHIFITVAVGANITVLASDLGLLTLPYLMVNNPDLINKGEYMVEFL